MRKPAAPVQVSVCLPHVLDFNWWRITVIIVWLSTCLRFPKDLMPDYLYPSFDMKRLVLALCSEKRLPSRGTRAISSNSPLAPLYISLRTKKPSSDMEVKKSLVESPLFFGTFHFLLEQEECRQLSGCSGIDVCSSV